MSRLNWLRERSPVIGVLIFVFGGVIWAGLLKHQELGNSDSQYSGPEQVQEYSNHYGLMVPAVPPEADTPPRSNNPDRSEWREERDLQAQTEMARWSKPLFIVTLLGVIAVFATVVEGFKATSAAAKAVAQSESATIQATRANEITLSALDHAKEASQKELRAYVGIDRAYVVNKHAGDDYTFVVKIKNFGATPATSVHITYDARPLLQQDDWSVMTRTKNLGTIMPGGYIDVAVFYRSESFAIVTEILKKGDARGFYAFGKIRYLDSFMATQTTDYRYILHVTDLGELTDIFDVCNEGNDCT